MHLVEFRLIIEIAESAKVIGLWDTSLQESIVSAYQFREELRKHLLDISINNSNANSALAASQPTISHILILCDLQ